MAVQNSTPDAPLRHPRGAFALSEVSMSTDTTTAADEIEAEIRKAMARVTKARGWDTGRTRADEIAYVDALLDSYNDLGR